MNSITKDELKINTSTLSEDRPTSRLKTKKEILDDIMKSKEYQLTNYDEMLKELIEFVHDACDDTLDYIARGNSTFAAYSIGRLHKTVSDAIENFGIGHLFKNEADND